MTSARRLFWFTFILLVTIAGMAGTCTSCARHVVLVGSGFGDTITGSGRETDEVRALAGPVTTVEIDGIGEVTILDDAAATVTVHADERIQPCLETVVIDRVLHIRTRPNTSFRCESTPRFTVRIPPVAGIRQRGCGTTTALALRGATVTVDASGVGNLVLGGTATAVELEQDGSGNVDARRLHAATWRIRHAGVGNLRLAGKAQSASVRFDGSGGCQGRDWDVGSAVVEASGVGSLDLGRVDELDVTLSGVGTLTYAGHPVIKRQSITGIGGIRSR